MYPFNYPDLFQNVPYVTYKNHAIRGAWVAQSFKHSTLDLGSGHDLMVYECEPRIGFHTDSVEPALDSWSPSLSAPLPLAYALSLSLSK